MQKTIWYLQRTIAYKLYIFQCFMSTKKVIKRRFLRVDILFVDKMTSVDNFGLESSKCQKKLITGAFICYNHCG